MHQENNKCVFNTNRYLFNENNYFSLNIDLLDRPQSNKLFSWCSVEVNDLLLFVILFS